MTGNMGMEFIRGRTDASTKAFGTMESSMETASTGRLTELSAEAAGRKVNVATGWTKRMLMIEVIKPTKSESEKIKTQHTHIESRKSSEPF